MQPINAVAFVYDDVFKGLSEVILLRNVLFIATFMAFLPAVVIFDYYKCGLIGIWCAFCLDAYRGALLMRMFNKNISSQYV